jgi:hydroxypyruvate isomerase
MRIKQSICIPSLRPGTMTLEAFIEAVAKLGYEGVEFWGRYGDFEEAVALAKRFKLAVTSMVGHNSNADGLNKRINHDRIEAELKASIDIAVRVGMRGVICFSGNRQEGQADADAIDACVQGLRRVAPYAEKSGVTVMMELLNSKVDHIGYQCDHTAWGVKVCEKVNSPRVKLLYDIYHMQIMEGDVIRTIEQNIKWIGHFHTAGNPGRSDFDDTQELNYTGICRAIAATDYDGYVGQEFRPKGDVIEAMRRARAICDQG